MARIDEALYRINDIDINEGKGLRQTENEVVSGITTILEQLNNQYDITFSRDGNGFVVRLNDNKQSYIIKARQITQFFLENLEQDDVVTNVPTIKSKNDFIDDCVLEIQKDFK